MKIKCLLLVLMGVILALPVFPDGPDLKTLANDLSNGDSAGKIASIEKIGRFNNLSAVRLLMTLAEERSEEIQSALFTALSSITDDESVAWMNDKAINFPNPAIRALLINVLSDMGNKGGLIHGAVIQTLKDNDLMVRQAAINALGGIPAEHPDLIANAIEYLTIPLADQSGGWELRQSAMKFITKYDTRKAFDTLLLVLNENDFTLQWELEEALNQYLYKHYDETIDYLINDRFNSYDPAARAFMAKLIGRQASRFPPAKTPLDDCVKQLLAALETEDAEPAICKIQALANISNIKLFPAELRNKIIEALVELMRNSQSAEIRLNIAAALVEMDCRDFGITLQTIIYNETDWRVKSLLKLLVTNAPDESAIGEVPTLFANRFGKDKVKALEANGGNEETEKAIQRGLLWLALHQSLDGRWSLSGLNPFSGKEFNLPDFTNEDQFMDAAATGLAMLSFMGSGSTHKYGKYRAFVKAGLDYILSCQDSTGAINLDAANQEKAKSMVLKPICRRYNHSISTLALVEAYAMTKDETLLPSINKALEHARNYRVQLNYPWSFYLEPTDIGTSIYYIMSLFVASEAAGLKIPPSQSRDVEIYLERLTNQSTGRVCFLEGPSYCFGGYDSMATGIASRFLLRSLLNHNKYMDTDKKATEFLMKYLPVWEPYRGVSGNEGLLQQDRTVIGLENNILNQFYWYFMTMALIHSDYLDRETKSEYWTKWNNTLKDVLLKHQRVGGDNDGSWDPVCAWGSVGGRLYSTTFGILNLQLYYSYNLK
ncbi:MAG: hypothetical protein HY811_04660 [Planctomycetes bacterium]|nr:hypothetical protein [Planctomycetota bacterium]